jgi:hypothetical protein
LESLHIGSNQIPAEKMNAIIATAESRVHMRVLCSVPFKERLTQLDVGGKSLGVEGAVVLSHYLKSDLAEALSIVNIMGNGIGKARLLELQEIANSTTNLVSLCGIADDATEADFSNLVMDGADTVILAAELPAKVAMKTLIISHGSFLRRRSKALSGYARMQSPPCMHTLCPVIATSNITHLDISGIGVGMLSSRSVAAMLKNSGAFLLRCEDGTPYKSEKSMMRSTHICKFCGQRKTAHTQKIVVSLCVDSFLH